MSHDTQEFVAFVGIDWADQQHAICELSTAHFSPKSRTVSQKAETISDWIADMRLRYGPGHIAVCLELSRGGLVATLLQHEGIVLYPINPKQLSRYRDAMCPSGSKNDPGDARLLAEFVRDHHLQMRPWIQDDELTRTLAMCCENRRKLVDDKKRTVQRLQCLLKSFFPVALELLSERIGTKLGQDFLVRWSSLTSLKRARPEHILRFLREHNCRSTVKNEERIETIRKAVPLTKDQAIVEPSAMMARSLALQLRQLDKSIAEFDKQIESLMDKHPQAAVFRSLPGAGAASAPRLLVAMGSDLNRYQDAAELQAFSGIAPVTKQSGKSKVVQRRRACPKFLRQTFHEFAEFARRFSKWSQAYYLMQRKRGKCHNAAVRALAFKWIRIIYRIWQTGEVYDEAKYIQQLRKRNSPALPFLQSAEA